MTLLSIVRPFVNWSVRCTNEIHYHLGDYHISRIAAHYRDRGSNAYHLVILMTVVREPAPLAEEGAQLELGKPWRCGCAREHKWGWYAAAHWHEVLTHTCACGVHRTFEAGYVLTVKEPE
jgi:hypothetical protein